MKAYEFDIENPEPGTYAPGFPYVVEYGETEVEAREAAQTHLDPGEKIGALRGCACAKNNDGSVTTMLCPRHADDDPCYTAALVTGRRRRGTIRRGTCTNCGWKAK